ncbi:hypothetical protein [Paucibacter soli]|uniref:hypothetical protein n=1 Tax=Paucibacter soli TaxID=3133433 RepID=UPI0030AFF35D
MLLKKRPVWIALLGCSLQALAQPGDPADAQARVPGAVAPKALDAYRRFDEAPATPWRAANEQVLRNGGWRAYAREAAQPAQPASAASPASAPRGVGTP